jgi:hypothetical protein
MAQYCESMICGRKGVSSDRHIHVGSSESIIINISIIVVGNSIP